MLTRDNPMLVLYEAMAPGRVAERFDLMLTPGFYVVKREKLPLRFAFQARRVAPSILDELTGEGEFRYEVYRDGEEWVFLAYDRSKIEEFLKQRGIKPTRIGGIYFAQQIARELNVPVCLGQGALVNVKGTVTLLPRTLLSEEGCRPMEGALPRPGKRFGYEGSATHWIEGGTAFALSILAILFALLFFAEGLNDSLKAKKLEEKVVRASEGVPALASRITRTNIHGKYLSIDRAQREIRDTIRRIGSLVSKDSKLERLSVTPEGYEAVIKVSDAGKVSNLEKLARKEDLNASVGSDSLTIKGVWSR